MYDLHSGSAPQPASDRLPAVAGLHCLWARTMGHPAICIAVLDGPADLSHPAFHGARLTVLDPVAPTEFTGGEALAHGTHVASLLFGQPGGPVLGVAPGCRGVIIPVFGDRGDGSLAAASQLDVARGIAQAIQQGAHIINISAGQLDMTGEPEPFLVDAIRLCARHGVLLVAAAGNGGCRCLHVPAAEPWVLAVGAMDARGEPLGFSNWGDAYQQHGILAPGGQIRGAVPGGGVADRSGTSSAAALVSGGAALLLSMQLLRGERPEPAAVRAALLQSAIGCDEQPAADCRRLLVGRLNLVGALTLLTKGEEDLMCDQHSHSDPAGAAQPPAEPGIMTSDLPLPNPAAAPEEPARGQVHPSDCGCGCGGAGGCSGGGKRGPSLVYALGAIDFDFGSEARRDSFTQSLNGNPHDPAQLLTYLQQNPWDAGSLIWTLNLETTPIYAIQPAGPFAAHGYERLRQFLQEQLTEAVERVSVPGYVVGSARLLSGQTVPVIYPELRGMYSWATPQLVNAVLGDPPKSEAEATRHKQKSDVIQNFLERVYYELRNLGLTPQERALNFAATNAFQIEYVFRNAIEAGMKLDSMDVERSPLCRPGADCWDVKLTFFNPAQRLEHARMVYRFTVDVSDVIPVTVGKVRNWHVY